MSERVPLPDRRASWRQKARIGGQTVYLTVGEYPDGRPGEVFIDVAKTGTLLRGALDSLSRVVSNSLQCGAPLEEIVDSLRGVNYPPNGPVIGEGTNVKTALSIPDWVGAELAQMYLQPTSTESVPDETEV